MKDIVKALTRVGIDAHETVKTAGLYYDGTQHGLLIPAVMVCTDKHVDPLPAINKILRYRPEYTAIYSAHFHYNIYFIMNKQDAPRMDDAQREADIFLTAFWQCIHNNPAARENNAALATAAGRRALKEAAADLIAEV